MPRTRAPRLTICFELSLGIEVEPDRDAEAVAQRIGQQAGTRGRADQREARQIDLDRARCGARPDDEIELEVLHGRIEDLLDRRVEPMDLIDEQHIAILQIGEERRQIARLGDDRTRGRAEVDAELARHDLRQRGLAEPGRPDEQHMVESFLPGAGGLDEDLEIGARLLLADELGQLLRSQRCLGDILLAALSGDQPARRRHGAALVPSGAKYQFRTIIQHSMIGTTQARIRTASGAA